MGHERGDNFLRITLIAITISWVTAQDYYEEHHRNQINPRQEHYTDIPKQFEVEGEDVIANFNRHVTNIQNLATKKNLQVHYKVKVTITTKPKHRKPNRDKLKNGKSKKYNIPLKKKNMKLSSFEIVMRKRVNDLGFQSYKSDDETTTDRQRIIYTTRSLTMGKYKPIISAAKTKYAKIIRPVRNKIITLES